jgi:SAM-dependent methyltransferase
MSRLAIRHLLPHALRAPLWGDRERWGLTVDEQDPCWREWLGTYADFYLANQREGIGTRVNDAGYRVMSSIDLSGKHVLEIGAGDIRHMPHWRGKPAEYLLADVSTDMMNFACKSLIDAGIQHRTLHVERNQPLGLDDASVDVIVSFYSLEHLYPLRPYLEEMHRVLQPGGILIGAIPAEGGLAWGGGRLLTSRRWFKKNTSINPDKIICWEHPNFADQIVAELDQVFERQALVHWPLRWVPALDLNLILRFQYRKPVA